MANPRSILITGCSSGIGYAAAQALQQRGYQVFATARQQQDVNRLRAEGLLSTRLDLSDPASIKAALDEVLEHTGGTLFALFNNGAYGQPGALEDLPLAALRAQFETNVFGWHELTRQVIAVMRRQGHGRIIQNSSVLGFVCLPYRGAYNASKYAIEALSDTLRLELHGSNIHIVLIEPGPISSEFRNNAKRQFKRFIDPDNSVHQHAYLATYERLNAASTSTPFTLPPAAVVKRLIHALESKRPRLRYPVTVPTYLFTYLKRIVPARVLDQLLKRLA